MKKGGAKPGEKTLVDTLVPVEKFVRENLGKIPDRELIKESEKLQRRF